MGKTILLTGGAGFIGAHLANDLLANGYKVRVIDNLVPQVHGPGQKRPAYLPADAELQIADIRDSSAVARALDKVDQVVHLASLVGVGQSMYQIDEYTCVNNLGTAILLQALIKAPVERLVVASSMSIYGEGLCRNSRGLLTNGPTRLIEQLKAGEWELRDHSGDILTPVATPEDKTPSLASIYALSKYDQERMCLIMGAAYGLPTVALRFFNTYGPYQALSNPYTGVLSNFASRVLNGKPPLIFEDGLQQRDIVSVYDVASACRRALESPEAPGKSFNISSGQPITVKEAALRTIRAIGSTNLEPEITGKYRVGDIRHCFADISPGEERTWLATANRFGTGPGGSSQLAGRTDGRGRRGQSAHGTCGPRIAGMSAMLGSSGESQPVLGLAEWFAPGEFGRVEQVLTGMRALRISDLRVGVSWADWYSSEGDGWYEWLLPRLAQEVNIVPCFVHTPPSVGLVPKFSSPPQVPKAYADFLDVIITRFGSLFEWMELWNRPDDQNEWDFRLDPNWSLFSEMIGGAAFWARSRGKKTILPSLWPADTKWIGLMRERGVLKYIDAVGIHAYPGSRELPWKGWKSGAAVLRESLRTFGSNAEVWITTTGFSTWRNDEFGQVKAFVESVNAPVSRVYWRETRDRKPATINAAHSDERDYHYGLTRSDGSPKLLFSLWSGGGVPAVRQAARERTHPQRLSRAPRHVLITGGAGFIGTNLAHRLLSQGQPVMIYDDLSRQGVHRNVEWLRKEHGGLVSVEIADVRNRKTLRSAVEGAGSIFHFAAQVAVTTSLADPVHDFEVNVGGTLNLLEEVRSLGHSAPLLFTSTNKVYGGLSDLELESCRSRYLPADKNLRAGISEGRPLDFHSPYGCSKGAADQYVLDYARSFGLPAVVFRMSCIYGFHQMGTEDQGWVAHFLIRALKDESIMIYGDGKQVRDLLFVDDLVDAFLLAQGNIHSISGEAFNIGGGLGNTLSLIELLDMIAALNGSKPETQLMDWRCGDQRYYVSNTNKFKSATGWSPKVNAHEGVRKLLHWLRDSFPGDASHVLSAPEGGYAVLPH